MTLINSWSDTPLDILSNLRAHLKQERAATAATLKATGSEEDADRGLASASGLEAKKSEAFLVTKRQLAGCKNFLAGLDILLSSRSKPWYMKAIKQMLLASQNVAEMESCSEYLDEWPKYWPMVISRGKDGKVHTEVQGEEFPVEQVKPLLSGLWHQVDWVLLMQKMEYWTDDAEPDVEASLRKFDTLTSVTKLLVKTMKMLKLARDSDSEEDPCTCIGFMAKVLRLERRSRALPKLPPAREQALDNMVNTLNGGLKEFGARWAKQWAKPTNYSNSLLTSFVDVNCFIMRKFDKLDKVADTLHEMKEVLPVIFQGGCFQSANQNKSDRPLQRGKEAKVPGRLCLLFGRT